MRSYERRAVQYHGAEWCYMVEHGWHTESVVDPQWPNVQGNQRLLLADYRVAVMIRDRGTLETVGVA